MDECPFLWVHIGQPKNLSLQNLWLEQNVALLGVYVCEWGVQCDSLDSWGAEVTGLTLGGCKQQAGAALGLLNAPLRDVCC